MLLAAFDRGARGVEHGPGFLFPLLMITLLALLFVWFRKRRHGAMHYRYAGGSPKQTLEDRFARGEIDRGEFEHRRAVLDGDEVIPPAPARPAPAAPPADSEPTVSSEPTTDPTDAVADSSDQDDGTA